MAQEIAEGAAPDKLNERLKKITLVNDLIDLGNAARIANLQGRANRDLQVMAEGIKTVFPAIEGRSLELEPISRSAENKQQLKEVMAAASGYKAAMQKYSDIFAELDRNNMARVDTGGKARSRSLAPLCGQAPNRPRTSPRRPPRP